MMAELLPCPFCGSGDVHITGAYPHYIYCLNCGMMVQLSGKAWEKDIPELIKMYNTRIPKERGADNPKITCLNCKHLIFSDMYGECNKQLKIVNPSDTCEYAEPKERDGEK